MENGLARPSANPQATAPHIPMMKRGHIRVIGWMSSQRLALDLGSDLIVAHAHNRCISPSILEYLLVRNARWIVKHPSLPYLLESAHLVIAGRHQPGQITVPGT